MMANPGLFSVDPLTEYLLRATGRLHREAPQGGSTGRLHREAGAKTVPAGWGQRSQRRRGLDPGSDDQPAKVSPAPPCLDSVLSTGHGDGHGRQSRCLPEKPQVNSQEKPNTNHVCVQRTAKGKVQEAPKTGWGREAVHKSYTLSPPAPTPALAPFLTIIHLNPTSL